WDEGPDPSAPLGPGLGGPHAPYVQSERYAHYELALDRLAEAGRLFPCRVSRKELQEIASAPHGHDGLPPYPAALRPTHLAPGWLARLRAKDDPDAALRFRVHDAPVAFEDRVQGRITERVSETTG